MKHRMPKPVLIVHGGAGDWPRAKHERAIEGVKRACERGYDLLRNDSTALEAVEAAVIELEDDPTFNAGRGSTMNLAAAIENDASIMDGRTLETGSVALVNGVRNPIKLARLVMEKTDHVLIAGKTTQVLAEAFGLAKANPVTGARRFQWKAEKARLVRGNNRDLRKNLSLVGPGRLWRGFDTVGALAMDWQRNLAAAASTGGTTLKLPGRIGDTPLVGSGLYADNKLGAATATGIGELAIRTVISKAACDQMKSVSAQAAASQAIGLAARRVGRGLGLITIDRKGRHGVAHSTRNICWALIDAGGLQAGMTGRRVLK